jgi:enoyl-CoA hydratase
MLSFENIVLSTSNNILTIKINRPSKLNALNSATIKEIGRAFEYIEMDGSELRGVIITGEGEKAFAAGADISEIAGLNDVNGRKFSEIGQEVFSRIEKCSKPVIAAVSGFTLGGGCELAMACHMRIATITAKFGQPEVNLGLIPGYGGTQRLTQLIGKGKAFELLMTGDMIGANQALALGLVNHVVDTYEELIPKSEEILLKIASKAPLAISRIIDCVNAYYNDENGYQIEANSFANCCKSEDFREGTSAFLEKRKAEFVGK